VNAPRMTPANIKELAEKVAKKLKVVQLRRMPGMDDVAVALNSNPTYEEVLHVVNVLSAVVDTGHAIVKLEE
jgi:ethanolamine utilization protein EutA (predicted chaperonin)